MFSVFSSQPLGLLLTTPPISILVKLIYEISKRMEVPFCDLYGVTGVWAGVLVIIYSLFNCSQYLVYVTPSIEEIFAIFASWAFIEKSIGHLIEIFGERFSDVAEEVPEVKITLNLTGFGSSYGSSMKGYQVSEMVCKTNESELPLVWIIIEAGTFTLALFLYLNTRNRVQIHSKIRHFFTDCSLLISVAIFSFISNTFFKDIRGLKVEEMAEIMHYNEDKEFIIKPEYSVVEEHHDNHFSTYGRGIVFSNVDFRILATGFLLAIPVSVCMFIDQGFCSIATNSKRHSLAKPGGYHWDLCLVGLINIGLSIYTMPIVYLAMPHSEFYVKALATMKSTIVDGHVHEQPTMVREQRVTSFVGHLLILISLVTPSIYDNLISLVPFPVLDGLFLYLAVVTLYGNTVLSRVSYMFTDKSVYGEGHFSQKVDHRDICKFNFACIFQLVVLIGLGFCGIWVNLGFPFFTLAMLPVRHYLLPLFIDEGSLFILDSRHQK